jgi:hypothetical protein
MGGDATGGEAMGGEATGGDAMGGDPTGGGDAAASSSWLTRLAAALGVGRNSGGGGTGSNYY